MKVLRNVICSLVEFSNLLLKFKALAKSTKQYTQYHLIRDTSFLKLVCPQKNNNFEVSLVPKLSHNVGVLNYHIYSCVQVQARKFKTI